MRIIPESDNGKIIAIAIGLIIIAFFVFFA